MERRDFLRISTIGGLALLVSPSLLAIKKEKTGFSVGLFSQGKELSYEGYKRIEVEQDELFSIGEPQYSGIVNAYVNLPKMTFPQTPKEGKIRADEVRIYRRKDDELMLISEVSAEVWHGTITIVWH